MPKYKVSLVIPAYNEEKYIAACLDHAIKNSGGRFFEIIVIDNASTDSTSRIARGFPGVRVVHEPNKGLTSARQRGFLESSGDIVAYLDADTRLPESWFDVLEREFTHDLELICLSGPYRYYDFSGGVHALTMFYWEYVIQPTSRLVGHMVMGASFAVRRPALEKIGGFDTSIKFYGEDTDIGRKLSKIGKVKYANDFFILTSARRLKSEGAVRTGVRYSMNYIWEVVFRRPFSKDYQDIR
ncbi:MAG: hypothetical protein A3H71_03675 [Candidatus Sungbacteria bacterium RIFCSPLOWO2_02_FULL_48_13b]|uniref:Glycosyltransferase 2-like domain-containing protein n=2 Tax=Candidatus Sungiibacteriota TaxID=1817917 RepID=A0A1G2LDR5_9BACT|nr:MAG: hypothetical protein A3C12_00280 [Candidatus Sungbacteria bacterium RIFCSPHIGHO2_02_FULL_49_20]OHA09684.1 MAG: hypothetical protein A3H71_03675 [Candidatus Sungbacteria bacterium RIFCSPLOWO2_02_FULL_48_13b]